MGFELEKYRKALDAAQADAEAKAAKFNEAKAAAESAGENLLEGETFVKLEEIHKERATADQKVEEMKRRYVSMLEMEHPAEVEKTRDALAGEKKAEAASVQAAMVDAAKSLMETPEFKAALEQGRFHSTGVKVDLPGIEAIKRAALKTLLTGSSSTSGGAFIVNDRMAELVQLERRPRRMLDLITIGETDSDTVDYVRVTSRTNAAAETPEAANTGDATANAPESAIAFAVENAIVREIKHFIPATRTAMADAGQLRTIVDQELTEGVQERLDTQIANGSGAGNITGILNTAGILSQSIGSDTLTDAIHKAITKIRLQNYEPAAICIHPTDWETLRLAKDSNGNYIYGPPSLPSDLTTWGLNTVPTVAVPAGNPVVGDFKRAATLWLREGVRLAATDSHDDWFIRGLIAVLASMRGAFGVQRPGAICEITA